MTWEFEEFYDWADKNLELNLAAYKQRQLQRRINTVMGQAGTTSLQEYSELLEHDLAIRQDFLDYITINVTDFFRNQELFVEFEEAILEELVPNFTKLKIWSAACSIGSEPYSLAMIVKNNRLELKEKILATDIDQQVLDYGKKGVYKKYELKNLGEEFVEEYFKQKENDYILSPAIRQMVHFKKHDLLQSSPDTGFHAVVCRNVIIYFKREAKEELYQKFSQALVPGGLLFTGATETIYKPEIYNLEKIGTFIYKKV